MRQVGDRLIPVGVSSSRLGADLPPGSTTGPGGAIIIGENARWGGERRGSRGRRGGELAQFLQSLGGGPDVEEVRPMCDIYARQGSDIFFVPATDDDDGGDEAESARPRRTAEERSAITVTRKSSCIKQWIRCAERCA